MSNDINVNSLLAIFTHCNLINYAFTSSCNEASHVSPDNEFMVINSDKKNVGALQSYDTNFDRKKNAKNNYG